MAAQIPGMGDAGRVYTGIYRRYGKYPVYTGIFGVLRPLYGLPAPRRATARRAGPSAARTWRRSSHAPVGLLLFTGARDGGVGRRRRTRCPRAARARGAARLRLAAAEPGSRGVPVYGSPKSKIPGMGKRARVYTGIYRYFTIPVYTLRNTRAPIPATSATRRDPRDARIFATCDLRDTGGAPLGGRRGTEAGC